MYTHRKFDSKTALWARKQLYGNQISRGIVEAEMYTHRKIWFPKRPFRARKQLYGNQISRGMVEAENEKTKIKKNKKKKKKNVYTIIHIGNLIPKTALSSQKAALRGSNFKRYVEGECIHIGNLIPKRALSSQKAALRESNLKRYGRRQICTHRNCDSQNGPLEPKSSFTTSWNLIPVKLLSGSKGPFWESNFLCV